MIGIVIIMVIAVLLISAGLYLLYLLIPQFDGWLARIRLKHRGRKIAVLTFDDGPDEPWTSQVLDILKCEKIEASFFILGSKAKNNPEIIRRMADEGHDIGNHSTSHRKLFFQNRRSITADIIETSNIVAGIIGEIPLLFRSPHGFKTPGLKRMLDRLGLSLIPWTRGIWDTDGSDADRLLKRFSRKFAALEILLLHDGIDASLTSKNRDATVAALPRIIAEYRRRGYKFVKISELD